MALIKKYEMKSYHAQMLDHRSCQSRCIAPQILMCQFLSGHRCKDYKISCIKFLNFHRKLDIKDKFN